MSADEGYQQVERMMCSEPNTTEIPKPDSQYERDRRQYLRFLARPRSERQREALEHFNQERQRQAVSVILRRCGSAG